MRVSLTQKIGTVFSVIIITAILELFNNIILGRNLSPEYFGRFRFITTIVMLVSTIILFGQNLSIIRAFNKENLSKYNWRNLISKGLRVAVFVGASICLIIGLYYKLSIEMFFGFFIIIGAVIVEYFSALYRAQERYEYSMLISKSISIFFFVVLIFLFYAIKINSFYWVLLSYFGVYLLISAIILKASNKLPCGNEPVSPRIVKEGLLLFFISLSFTIMTQVDQFFISKILGFEKLADYSVIITVTRGYELISVALWFVLMPHYSRDLSRSIKRDSLIVSGVGVLVTLFYIIWGTFFLHLFFEGKYDHSAYLLKYFFAIGFLRVLYSIPSGIIAGRLPEKYLKFFLGTCIIGIFINLFGNYLLIPKLGLKGAALAALAAWIFRLITAYFVVHKQSKSQYKNISSFGLING